MNPVRTDYNSKQVVAASKQQLSPTDKMLLSPVAYVLAARSTAVETTLGYALTAAGRLWDEQHNKMASYKELLHHVDNKICMRWTLSAENKFGRLFQGFPPNGKQAEGLDVLSLICCNKVLPDKSETYPCFMVNHQPEKLMNHIEHKLLVAVTD